MKIFKKIVIPALVIMAAMVLYNSCKEDDLELVNPNELSPETYFKTPTQVESAVNAVYGSLQTTSLYNRHIWFGNDNMSHENSGNSQLESDKRQYLNFTFDAQHGAIGGYWETCYRGINKANFVINNSQAINLIPDAQLSQVMKDKYIGEAKFLRGLYYFLLVDKFGAVPLYLDVPADGKGLARTAVPEIYAQIEADLVDAAAMLKTKAEEAQLGRATKGAAWALLGKVRLYQKKYQGALDAFANVTGYSLEPNYFDNFIEEKENGVESIFEVQFSVAAGSANRWDSDRSDQGLNEATFRGQEYGFANWYNVYPSKDLWEEYETVAVNGVKTDPRRGYNIYQNGDTYGPGGSVVVNIPADVVVENGVTLETITRRGWKKYQNYYKDATEGAVVAQASGINMKVIRYADVLLMMAEAEANKPGSLAIAVGYMNQVRLRADVTMPLYGTAAMDAAGYPVGTLAQFMVALEHERKVELAGEQVRFPDLVRWGRLPAFMVEVKPSLPILDQRALAFDPAKNILWPIPQPEIDRNVNIGQGDQNTGY